MKFIGDQIDQIGITRISFGSPNRTRRYQGEWGIDSEPAQQRFGFFHIVGAEIYPWPQGPFAVVDID